MLTTLPHSISNNINNFGHQLQLAERAPLLALPRAQLITGIRLEADCPMPNIQMQPSDLELARHRSTLFNRARMTIQP